MSSDVTVVGLMADPGIPSQISAAIYERLASALRHDLGGEWEVRCSTESLPVDPDGEIPLDERAPSLMERHGWDVVVYLSDLTQRRDEVPVRYEVSDRTEAVIVFVPTIGVWRQRARVVRLVQDLLAAGSSGWPPRPDDMPAVRASSPLAHLRMLAGMVHSNRPSGMLRALSGCTAVGLASGAFGVFFGSVWQLVDTLAILRLTSISLFVVASLAGWLIVRNGLWTRPSPLQSPGHILDNTSTIITVWSAVALMHLLLMVGLTVLAFVVVDSAYFGSQLGHPAGVTEYVRLGWFAASLGTMAGALGSNFDSEESVREATFSKRWYERRKLFENYDR